MALFYDKCDNRNNLFKMSEHWFYFVILYVLKFEFYIYISESLTSVKNELSIKITQNNFERIAKKVFKKYSNLLNYLLKSEIVHWLNLRILEIYTDLLLMTTRFFLSERLNFYSGWMWLFFYRIWVSNVLKCVLQNQSLKFRVF